MEPVPSGDAANGVLEMADYGWVGAGILAGVGLIVSLKFALKYGKAYYATKRELQRRAARSEPI